MPSGQRYTPPSATCTAPLADSGTGARDTTSSGSSDALGPVCTKLAACCASITDSAALQGQCYTAVANGLGDPGCQIGLNDITRVGYCAGM